MSKHTSQAGGRYFYRERKGETRRIGCNVALGFIAGVTAHTFGAVPGYSHESLTAEIKQKLLLALPKIVSAVNPEGFAWTVAKNHARSLLRQERRCSETPVSQWRGAVASAEEDDDVPFVQKGATEQFDFAVGPQQVSDWFRERRAEAMAAKIDYAINKLPRTEQAIIREYFWQDRTFEQIAEGLGRAQSYVHEIYLRSLNRLRILITPLRNATRPKC